jgi:hypothetical protein
MRKVHPYVRGSAQRTKNNLNTQPFIREESEAYIVGKLFSPYWGFEPRTLLSNQRVLATGLLELVTNHVRNLYL